MSHDVAVRPSRWAVPALAISVVLSALTWIDGLTIPEADATEIRRITLPIHRDHLDEMRWTDTWGAPRSGGRRHEGVDMLGPKMVPVVAVRTGSITWLRYNNARGSIIELTDEDGWEYHYIHLNNDTPGTDDGRAECAQVFSARICTFIDGEGDRFDEIPVTEGEVIGYVGDSGNAEWTSAHLHFEMAAPVAGGTVAVNPTPHVDAAKARLTSGVGRLDPPAVAAPGEDGFVDHLWFRLHGRYPTGEERSDFGDDVAEDGVWSAVASEIGEDTTASVVDRLYLAFFLRYADTTGMQYWVDVRASGYSVEQIAEWFAESEEFRTRYAGTTFEEFLDQLYREVLGRESDLVGKTYWLDLLEQGRVTRGTIVVYFTESAEMKASTRDRGEVVAATLLASGRTPTGADAAAWEALRAENSTADALAAWFAGR